MTKPKGSVLTIATVVLLGIGAGYLVRAQTTTHNVGRVPVTVVYESKLPSGESIFHTYSYRSDGSVAQSVLLGGDTQAAPVDVYDVTNKRHFIKDPATKMIDAFPISQESYDAHRLSPRTCEAAFRAATCEPVGSDSVLGYRVQKVTITPSNRPGLVYEEYLAPGLSYITLQKIRRQNGEVSATTRAISIRVGEPDSATFELPADYTTAKQSSEFITEMQVKRGRPNPYTPESRQKFDELQQQKRIATEQDPVR